MTKESKAIRSDFPRVAYILGALLFGVFVTTPTLILPTDVWDGVLLQHVSERHNYSDLWRYFLDSTWYLQYWLVVWTIQIADAISLSYKNTNAFLCILIFISYLREIWILARNRFKLEISWCILLTAIVALYPTWSCLLSSVLTFHLLCISIGLSSIRLLHARHLFSNVVAVPLVLASYSLQSQLVFLPVLSFAYDLLRTEGECRPKRMVSVRTIGVFLMAVGAYLFSKLLFPPTGIFLNYQGLIITSISGIFPAFLRGLHFVSFIVPLALLTFMIAPVCICTVGSASDGNNDARDRKTRLPYLAVIIMLFLAGAFPYVAVGKSAILWEVNDWVGRQAFLIVMPTALLSVMTFRWYYSNAISDAARRVVLVMIMLYLLVMTTLLMLGVSAKMSRQRFISQLTEVIKKHETELPPGLIQIVGDDLPLTVFEFYEPNYLMFQATGKSHWYARIGQYVDPDFSVIPIVLGRVDYQNIFVYNPAPAELQRHTLLTIKAEGFQGVSAMMRNAFGIGTQGTVIYLQSSRLTSGNVR